jgi:hypothetical protein
MMMHLKNGLLQLNFCWAKAESTSEIPQLDKSPHLVGRKCAGFKFPFIQPRLQNGSGVERNKHNGHTIFIEEMIYKCQPGSTWTIDKVQSSSNTNHGSQMLLT